MNNIKFRHPLLAVLIFAAACNESQKQPAAQTTKTPDSAAAPKQAMESMAKPDSAQKIAITEADLADKKDPVCGMPAFRYMEDTAVYNNKIYAFCSKDCKDEFVKNPTEYVKAEKPKK